MISNFNVVPVLAVVMIINYNVVPVLAVVMIKNYNVVLTWLTEIEQSQRSHSVVVSADQDFDDFDGFADSYYDNITPVFKKGSNGNRVLYKSEEKNRCCS